MCPWKQTLVLFCFVYANGLQPIQKIAGANLVAARTMGANRYMSTVMQQNRGVAFGDDTDMVENPTGASPMGEGAESEAATFDPTVPVSEASGELTRTHDTLRQELNSFLARELGRSS